MGVKIPASFEDSTGTVVRLTGELEFDVPATPGQVLTADDPAATASFAAGGGSVPLSVSTYSFESDGITTGGSANPDWVLDSGDALLDLTVPNTPEVLSAGVYLIAAYGDSNLATPGGSYNIQVTAYDTPTFDNQLATSIGTGAYVASASSCAGLPLLVRMPSTGVFQIGLSNNDGVAAVSIEGGLTITKLSD